MTIVSTSSSSSWISQLKEQDTGQPNWTVCQVEEQVSYNKEGLAVFSQSTSTSAEIIGGKTTFSAGETLYFATAAGATSSLTLAANINPIAPTASSTGWNTGTTGTFVRGGPNVRSPRFNSSGTRMFVVDEDAGIYKIYRYTLSTPWDATSASATLDSDEFSTGATSHRQIQFSPDGVFLYVFPFNFNSGGSEVIVQYVLSTPWMVSTASLLSTTTVTGGTSPNPWTSFQISGDGRYLLILRNTVGNASRTIARYTLPSKWIIPTTLPSPSTASYNSQTTSTEYLSISPDGVRFISAANTFSSATIGTFSSPWGAVSATTAIGVFPVTLYYTSFSLDGSTLYNVGVPTGQGTNQQVKNNTAGYCWANRFVVNISALTFASTPVEVFTLASKPTTAVRFDNLLPVNAYFDSAVSLTRVSSSPTQFVGTGLSGLYTNNQVRLTSQLTSLSANSSITSTSATQTNDYTRLGDMVPGSSTSFYAFIATSSINTRSLLIVSNDGSSLGVSTLSISGTDTPGCAVTPDGLGLFITSSVTNNVTRYNMSTANTLSTLSISSPLVQFTPSVAGIVVEAIQFSTDGLNMYLLDTGNDQIHRYSLTAPYAITGTVTLVGSFSYGTLTPDCSGFRYANDGRTFYLLTPGSNTIFELPVTTPWSLPSSATSIGQVTVQPGCNGLGVSPDGTRIIVGGNSTSGNIRTVTLTAPSVSTINPTSVVETPTGTYTVTLSTTWRYYDLEILPSPSYVPTWRTATPANCQISFPWLNVSSVELTGSARNALIRHTTDSSSMGSAINSTTLNLWYPTP